MKNIELLSKICSVAGAPGHEKKIRDFIIGEIKKEGLSYSLDNIGNLTVTIKGKKEKSVMVAAHMDEIGFIVKHIDEKGFVFFHPLVFCYKNSSLLFQFPLLTYQQKNL